MPSNFVFAVLLLVLFELHFFFNHFLEHPINALHIFFVVLYRFQVGQFRVVHLQLVLRSDCR